MKIAVESGDPVGRGVLLEARGVFRSFGQTPALQDA